MPRCKTPEATSCSRSTAQRLPLLTQPSGRRCRRRRPVPARHHHPGRLLGRRLPGLCGRHPRKRRGRRRLRPHGPHRQVLWQGSHLRRPRPGRRRRPPFCRASIHSVPCEQTAQVGCRGARCFVPHQVGRSCEQAGEQRALADPVLSPGRCTRPSALQAHRTCLPYPVAAAQRCACSNSRAAALFGSESYHLRMRGPAAACSGPASASSATRGCWCHLPCCAGAECSVAHSPPDSSSDGRPQPAMWPHDTPAGQPGQPWG